jgi:ABC-type Mn2+/Zn2+ transport system ATPase subunit
MARGKTTLARSVLGLININEGKIERASALRIGYMHKSYILIPAYRSTWIVFYYWVANRAPT